MGLISRVSSRTYRKKQHANLRPRRGHPRRLRYPGGGHHPDRAPSARWRPKAKEEGLHHPTGDLRRRHLLLQPQRPTVLRTMRFDHQVRPEELRNLHTNDISCFFLVQFEITLK